MAQEVETVLPQGVGYAVVVGIGFFFAALMCGVSYIQVSEICVSSRVGPVADHPKNRYTAYSTKSSEEFNAASRNVKAGMIVSSFYAGRTTVIFILTFAPGMWCGVSLDMGSDTAPEFDCGVPIWDIRTILVCVAPKRKVTRDLQTD